MFIYVCNLLRWWYQNTCIHILNLTIRFINDWINSFDFYTHIIIFPRYNVGNVQIVYDEIVTFDNSVHSSNPDAKIIYVNTPRSLWFCQFPEQLLANFQGWLYIIIIPTVYLWYMSNERRTFIYFNYCIL